MPTDSDECSRTPPPLTTPIASPEDFESKRTTLAGGGAEVRRSCRRPCPSKIKLVHCAVSCCSNTEKSADADGAPLMFYPLPTKRTVRAQWIKIIPELAYAEMACQQKVCSIHFVDGEPSEAYPFPCLAVGGSDKIPPPFLDCERFVYTEKENSEEPAPQLLRADENDASSPECIELGDSPSPSRDHEPPAKRRRSLLEMDPHQPLAIPSTLENNASPASTSTARATPNPKKRVFTIGGIGMLRTPISGGIGQKQSRAPDGKVYRCVKSVDGKIRYITKMSTAIPQLMTSVPAAGMRAASHVVGLIPDSVSKAATSIPIPKLESGNGDKVPCEPPLTLMSALQQVRAMPVPVASGDTASTSGAKAKVITLMHRKADIVPESGKINSEEKDGLDESDECPDEPCRNCISSLPVLRRGLFRLEEQMDQMTNMVKRIVSQVTLKQVTTFVSRQQPGPGTTSSVGSTKMGQTLPYARGGSPATYILPPPTVPTPSPKAMRDNFGERVSYTIATPTPLPQPLVRSILLHKARSFTMEEYKAENGNVVRRFPEKALENVLKSLMSHGCLRRTDADVTIPHTNKDAAYEKSTEIGKIAKYLLNNYGISVQQYLISLQ